MYGAVYKVFLPSLEFETSFVAHLLLICYVRLPKKAQQRAAGARRLTWHTAPNMAPRLAPRLAPGA